MDLDAHSKLPYFLRMHGSVMPRMIVPLVMVGAWATLITCISKFVKECASPLIPEIASLLIAFQWLSILCFSLFLVSWLVWHCHSGAVLHTNGQSQCARGDSE